MLKIEMHTRFKRDYKIAVKRGYDMSRTAIGNCVLTLTNNTFLHFDVMFYMTKK